MYPKLFSIGSFTVYTYGVFVAAGFFAAMQYITKYSYNIGFSKSHVYDFLFYIIIAGIVGARLLYVLINFGYFYSNPFETFKLWNGGLVYYGGFLTALLFAVIYLKNKKILMLAAADIFAPAVALGHFFGRIGCFFSGCCYGRDCDLFIALNNKYPTQLFEAFCNLAIFFILHKFNKKTHKPGLTFFLYLIIYPAVRFIIEFFRGDDRGMFIIGLSAGQLISIAIMIPAVLTVIFKYGCKYESK